MRDQKRPGDLVRPDATWWHRDGMRARTVPPWALIIGVDRHYVDANGRRRGFRLDNAWLIVLYPNGTVDEIVDDEDLNVVYRPVPDG